MSSILGPKVPYRIGIWMGFLPGRCSMAYYYGEGSVGVTYWVPINKIRSKSKLVIRLGQKLISKLLMTLNNKYNSV
jgi:hypothetical protein